MIRVNKSHDIMMAGFFVFFVFLFFCFFFVEKSQAPLFTGS